MDCRICFVLSAVWILTHALTLQQCHNGFEMTLGSVNTITCSEVKNNAVVTWRYGSANDTTGHMAGKCQGFSSSEDNSCSSALLMPQIAPHRVSNTSSTLTINSLNMEPGFVSCATPENGELIKCDFDVVYPAEGVNCEAQLVGNVTKWLVRGVCNVTRMMSLRQKYDCQWYSLKKESSLRNQLMNVPMVTKPLADDSRMVSGSCDVTMTFPVEADVYTFGVIITPGQVDTQAVFRGSSTVLPPSKPIFSVQSSGAGPVREFDNVTFHCKSDGGPMSQVRLRKETAVLTNGSQTTVFTITNVSCQDTGTYYCAAASEVEAGYVTSESFLGVYCAPRLPDNTDHPTLVKFSGQRAQHTFDVIAYPPPHLHNITVFDLKTVRFIADNTGSDLNVTCSHTNIRPYLSSCTMHINNISLPSKAWAIYKATLANELGQVEYSVNILIDSESSDGAEYYLKGMGVGIGVTIAVCLAVVAMVAAVLIVRRVLDPFAQCCIIHGDRNIFSSSQRNRNTRAEANEGLAANSRSNTQCAKQGACSVEEEYEVTDGYNNYTDNSVSGRPVRSILDEDDGEYISCT